MAAYRLNGSSRRRIEEVYAHTSRAWGEAQARRYVDGLFERFQAIADRKQVWRRIPADYGVSGYFCRYERHFIFWRELAAGDVGVAAILHVQMDVAGRLKSDHDGPFRDE